MSTHHVGWNRFLGPVVGPVAGSYVGQDLDWRWLFWLEAIFAAVTYVAGCIVPESCSSVLFYSTTWY